jgi:hypothetical protein
MRHCRALRILALAAVSAAAAAPARAQFRAGPEFRVNSYTTSDQYRPRVSVEREGEFVVAWQSYGQDGDNYGVFGQAFRDDGSRRGNEFRATVATVDRQERPVVAHDGNEFVVAWASYGQDGDGFGVHARRFEKDGTPLGAAFQVNTYTTGYQKVTSVAKDRTAGSRGAFVVVWTDYAQDYGNVMARRYDENGVPRGGEFRVNVFTPDFQTGGRVGMADDGRFVIVWSSYGQDGASHGVFARRFDAAGNPLSGDVQVNTTASGDEYPNGLAVAPDGRFVVVWQQLDGDAIGIFGRPFNAAGLPQAVEFRANTYTTGQQQLASVAINERGDFAVAWLSEEQDGSQYGVYGQRFDKFSNRLGQEFRVNTYTTGQQLIPQVGMDEVGNFVVAWASLYQDGSGWGVYAQRFGGILFPALGLDASPTLGPGRGAFASDGNGVLEPGETVTVETFWHNVSGVAQGPIGGHVNAFTGPPGPAYVVPDPNASFGVIPNGATVGCSVTGDCYTVGVSGTRPATHWDGVLEEGVNTIILGQAKLWAVHVGESFADVPRSSPFYRFIETLLHNSVTGGCTATQYCPQNSTSREQMAVFVLVSAEGATYRPVACGVAPPMFNDVPASSPFCPWVEELARRGVVAGCGGGNYCPSAAVSREQMAVFVLRTLDGDLDPPACTTPMFADVPASSPFCRWIEELARRGVVTGCGGGNYCPTAPVTREQMGVFLTVTFGLKLYGQ